MKRKLFFIISIVLIVCICVSITYIVTANYYNEKYQNRYQISSWVKQNHLTVNELNIETKTDKFHMFDTTLETKIKIKGQLKDPGNGYELYIKNIHISERIEEEQGQDVAYIKLTPIVASNLDKKTLDFSQTFEYEFNYDLHEFIPYKINKYVILCEGKKSIIEIPSTK